jgi:hypothetical protein
MIGEPVVTKEYLYGIVGKILYGVDPRSPREWDNGCKMICWHDNYDLGDVQGNRYDHPIAQICEEEGISAICGNCGGELEYSYGEWYHIDEACMAQEIKPVLREVVMLPLFLYDHSGLSISTTPFSCAWDSGMVGVAYMTLDMIKENWALNGPMSDEDIKSYMERAESLICAETNTYNQYLQGDIYGHIVEDSEGNILDSCWGFYDVADAVSDMNVVAEWHCNKISLEIEEAKKHHPSHGWL